MSKYKIIYTNKTEDSFKNMDLCFNRYLDLLKQKPKHDIFLYENDTLAIKYSFKKENK